MRKRIFSFPWKKYISSFLIFILLFTQTIQVNFFDVAEAKPEQYRDIVSLFVDTATFARERAKITRYAQDIQGYLGSTRVSLFVVDRGVSPAYIAAKNEKLYLEGDGDSGISKLVGTVLIGDIPVPMVGDGGSYFPSLYPYVDFVDKQFVYNTRSSTYETVPDANRRSVEADIWHGVINPAVGREWKEGEDIEKISGFLDKIHAFYTKSGKFAPSSIPPRVFYYDGGYESQSVNLKSLFQYALTMQNSENIAYKRFTRYLLKDINRTILDFDAQNDKEYNDFLETVGLKNEGDGFSEETMRDMPDIHAKTPILSFLKDFQSIINSTTLSDALANIHNAGRYNDGSNVRADLAPIQMTIMDSLARDTLKEANKVVMNALDSTIDSRGLAATIPIFDSITSTSSGSYDNYFFGKKSSTINSPEQCTIARGSNSTVTQFGRDELVEANVAYDVNTTESHAAKLSQDTEELVNLHKNATYACFDNGGGVRSQSYWGGNTLLRVAGSSSPSTIMRDPPSTDMAIKGFSESIFSLGGMKETTRLSPASIADCMDTRYQYALKIPQTYEYSVEIQKEVNEVYNCMAGYPKEWNMPSGMCPEDIQSRTPRYTCVTTHETRESIPTLESAKSEYNSRPCFAGVLTVNGATVASANRPCIETIGTGENITTVDKTVREDTAFHTIPSLLRHISPTDDEINAAEANGVTPSLPVDMIRYVEFLSKEGKITRINYPNFFEAPATTKEAFRAWLKDLSIRQMSSLGVENYFDWNTLVSDDLIDSIIRARNWLSPDVTKKYKKAIETTLSYSREYPGLSSSEQSPKFPQKINGYEIAYLGLIPFTPASSENKDPGISKIEQDYSLKLSEIKGLNISEPYDGGLDNTYANSDKCGPPEGVDIFQWPSAIMCWISSLLPPRIMAGSCSANTIGIDNNSNSSLSTPEPGLFADVEKLKQFYEGGKLFYAIDRLSMTPRENLEINFNYAKNDARQVLPAGSRIALALLSVVDANGQQVSDSNWSSYITVSPSEIETTDAGGKMLIASGDKKGTAKLRSTLSIRLPDGSTLEKASDIFTIKINTEYLELGLSDNNITTSSVDVTVPSNIVLNGKVKNQEGEYLDIASPLKLTVFDDVTGEKIESDTQIPGLPYTIPEKYTKKIGSYRFSLSDSLGRVGEISLTSQAGKLSRIVISPISTMIRKGSNTMTIVRLQDRLGNQIAPDVNQVTIEVSGGYLSDANGEKQTKMVIDSLESDIPVLIGSDVTGSIHVKVTTDSGISTESDIRVLDIINARVTRSSNPKVAEGPVDISIKIVDAAGNILDGFSSVASLSLPEDAGYFTPDAVEIKNGITKSFTYTPGTRSGVHKLRLDIPGVGTISDIDFSLMPGLPLYMTHREDDNNIIFALNDRYGNISDVQMNGTLTLNTDVPINIVFDKGIYTAPKSSGYYTLNVPDLLKSELKYTDSEGEHSIRGMPFYTTYIAGTQAKFNFLPDYNARYTVLYGDSYLREGEDILFDSDPLGSQSIAVTTLLDSPFTQKNLLSVLPGGNIKLSQVHDDMVLEAGVSLRAGYPLVYVRDSISQKTITQVLYKLKNMGVSICSSKKPCQSSGQNTVIELTPNEDRGFTGTTKNTSDTLFLENGGTRFLAVASDGKIDLTSGTTLHFLSEDTVGVTFEIRSGGTAIATMRYITDKNESVHLVSDLSSVIAKNTPTIDLSASITPTKTSEMSLGSAIFGYKFALPSDNKTIDDTRIGPNGIDSLGVTNDTPGVGWKGDNRSLLSYAAGDTVGEATKWFHTYTMINMGDPVAHVDHMAAGATTEGIDRTIGTQITSTLQSPVTSYAHRDMDKDGYEDIITLGRDGYLNLILNMGTRFRPRETLAYVPDLVARGVSLGDFHGDGYADILGLDSSGSFIYIDNTNRRFSRMQISLANGGSLPTGVTQFKIFDMDNDGRDDIVYIAESGEFAILYGQKEGNLFTKNILDSTLGVTISGVSETTGGAAFFDGIPQISPEVFGVSAGGTTEMDDSILQSEVYYQYSEPVNTVSSSAPTSDIASLQSDFEKNLGSVEASKAGSVVRTYVKSQYAPAYNLEISRNWKNLSNTYLHGGDRVLAEIQFKNTGNTPIKNLKYLDTIPAIFDATNTKKYEVILGDQKIERDFQFQSLGEFDAFFEGRDIPAGQTLTLRYELTSFPASYGDMIVSRLEGGESGDDQYGDVGFKASVSCGADLLLWRSGPGSRDYTRGSRTFAKAEIPDELKGKLTDNDKNNIPDSIDKMTNAELRESYKDLMTPITTANKSLFNTSVNTSDRSITLGFSDDATAKIDSMMQEFFDGLKCGFGGGSCMSFPVNWAPLAPGGAPSIFGFPAFPLVPETGLPTFSGITGLPLTIPCGTKICTMCVPNVFPGTVFSFDKPRILPGAGRIDACTDGKPGAGAKFGTESLPNGIRLYATPTLTLGMGGAICFSGPANKKGREPPPPLFGIVKGGNCIVAAKPMPFCKGDGSRGDGDVTGVSGLGSITDAWNSASCNLQAKTGESQRAEDVSIQREVTTYIKNPTPERRKALYTNLSQRGPRTITTGPMIKIGGGNSSGGATEVGVEIDTTKPFTLGNIIKVKNGQVPAFPGFIMNWVKRQVDEMVNALFTAPSLLIVWPGVIGANMQFDGNWENLKGKFNTAYSEQTFKDLKTQMGQAYANTDYVSTLQARSNNGKSGLAQDFKNWQNKALSGDTGKAINNAAGGLASVRAAYKLLGQLPFLNIERTSVPIDIPWILPGELDRYIMTLKNYEKEYDMMMKNWCAGKTPQQCADAKTSVNAGAFISSIKQNLSRLEEYKKFPLKIQKYITWKQRYMTELLCNVETVRQFLGGWVKDNGVRFRKWAELYVLIKAIAESWQPVVNLFTDISKECGKCQNQRNSTLDWKMKILGAILPSPPVINFPRWPNIVLDLSDIRLGISVKVPDFVPNIKPLRLPDLPKLSLPGSPTASLSLPALPILLPPIPNLPDLPSLPSLPRLAMPNLPPPPKIPKIFSSIAAVLKIMKLLGKAYCYLNDVFLVPEGEVGDVIAHKTERQGTLSFDFLGIQFPNFTLPSLREIRVSTHVNFELRSDFITEFARQAVKPINEFTTDLGRGIPKKIAPDVNIGNPIKNINITPRSDVGTGAYYATLQDIDNLFKAESEILLDTDELKTHLISEWRKSGTSEEKILTLQNELKKSEKDSQKLTLEILDHHNKTYDLLTKYIQAEYDSTAGLQNIVDLLSGKTQGDLGAIDIDLPRAQMVALGDISDAEHSYQLYTDHISSPGVSVDSESDQGLTKTLNQLRSRIDRIAATTTVSSSSSSDSLMQGYSPAYEGIYILTPSGVQTRLFDYTKGLARDEEVEAIDIDKDGDKDYIYRLDGALFIKYTGAPHRNENNDTTLKISSLKLTDSLPTAVNFFHEMINSPKSISLTFAPANENEREWRMTFFDKYLEWDMVGLDLHNVREVPDQIIDFFATGDDASKETSMYKSRPVLRSIEQVEDISGFQMEGPRITPLTEGTNFNLSALRDLYVGKNSVTITLLSGSGAGQQIQLEPYQSYSFPSPIQGRITRGMAYIFGSGEGNEVYTYSDAYIGMPIVSGMKVYSGNGKMSIMDHMRKIESRFSEGTRYMLRSLGNLSDTYSASVSYPNGMYNAKIQPLVDRGVISEVALFAPQVSSDTSAPVVDFPERIRIPVYAAQTFDLKEYISEMNDFTVVFDDNIRIDSDKNSIADDDFMTKSPNISLENNSLVFQPHTSLDTYTGLLKVTDERGNTTTKSFTVEIYAPIPQIQSVSFTGWVNGGIGEKIPQEPIHLFRVRPGQDIDKVTPLTMKTTTEGLFSSGSYFTTSGAIIGLGETKINLSERGVISIPAGYDVVVSGADAKNPLRMDLRNENGILVYRQFLVLGENPRIMSSTNNQNEDGLIVSPRSGYSLINATPNDTGLPGGAYITDSIGQAIAAIANDGNVYLLSPDAKLIYGTRDGYVSLSLLLKGTPVANLWYKTTFFYTVK